MLSTRALNSENLVVSDSQPLKITKAGTAPFYALGHPPGELRRGVSAFGSAGPYGEPFVTAVIGIRGMSILGNVDAHQLNIGTVESVDLSQSLGAFNSADEFQRSQPLRHIQLFLGGQDILPKAEPYRS